MKGLSTPASTDLERKAKELVLKHRHRTTDCFGFSIHKVPTQAQDVADQHLQAVPIGTPHVLDILDFVEQLSRAQSAEVTDVGNQQGLPGSARRVATVEPGKPFRQFWKRPAETSTHDLGADTWSVVVATWVRLSYLLHNVFSSFVIPRNVNAVICAGTNRIDIRSLQRDYSFVSLGARFHEDH